MAVGTVKWFDTTKGYGFIKPEKGGKDVFVHVSALERSGLSSLEEGQRIDYEIATNKGKQSAVDIKLA
jgi:CspA family cold shock protein